MPRPPTPLSTGKSGSASSTPKISRESSAIRLRKRTVDPHAEQLGTSRPRGPAGHSHVVPQILQVKFPESENVKCRPPVAILNGGEWFFLVMLAPGQILERAALLRMKCKSRLVRDEYIRRIAQQSVYRLFAAGVGVVYRQFAFAQQIHGLDKSPVGSHDPTRVQIGQIP